MNPPDWIYRCYRCDAPDSVPKPGESCRRCVPQFTLKKLVPLPPDTVFNVIDYGPVGSTPENPLGPPYISAWLKGGCMVCGAGERDANVYAHDACTYTLELKEWVLAWKACDEAKRAQEQTP